MKAEREVGHRADCPRTRIARRLMLWYPAARFPCVAVSHAAVPLFAALPVLLSRFSEQPEIAPPFEQIESHSAIVLLPGQGGPGESAKHGFASVEARGRDLVAEPTLAAGYSPFLLPSRLESLPTNCDSNILALEYSSAQQSGSGSV